MHCKTELLNCTRSVKLLTESSKLVKQNLVHLHVELKCFSPCLAMMVVNEAFKLLNGRIDLQRFNR